MSNAARDAARCAPVTDATRRIARTFSRRILDAVLRTAAERGRYLLRRRPRGGADGGVSSWERSHFSIALRLKRHALPTRKPGMRPSLRSR